jgi:hypothetical protein
MVFTWRIFDRTRTSKTNLRHPRLFHDPAGHLGASQTALLLSTQEERSQPAQSAPKPTQPVHHQKEVKEINYGTIRTWPLVIGEVVTFAGGPAMLGSRK